MTPISSRQISYGESSLRTLVKENCRYVDKTACIHRLISTNRRVFLSRPRRFGKTLLVDTLSEIFQGNKELFRGLFIYETDYDWESYPVIRLDMSQITRKTPELFKKN